MENIACHCPWRTYTVIVHGEHILSLSMENILSRENITCSCLRRTYPANISAENSILLFPMEKIYISIYNILLLRCENLNISNVKIIVDKHLHLCSKTQITFYAILLVSYTTLCQTWHHTLYSSSNTACPNRGSLACTCTWYLLQTLTKANHILCWISLHCRTWTHEKLTESRECPLSGWIRRVYIGLCEQAITHTRLMIKAMLNLEYTCMKMDDFKKTIHMATKSY